MPDRIKHMSSILIDSLSLWCFLAAEAVSLDAVRGSGKNTAAGVRRPGNHMVKDPVCGMYMDSRLAFRLDSRKETVYFCSEKCGRNISKPESNRKPQSRLKARAVFDDVPDLSPRFRRDYFAVEKRRLHRIIGFLMPGDGSGARTCRKW